jgi:2-polyprenyl-3-methyl-5-hydroxy-6-metoxy-1,4-benzoquinol methylase
MPTGPVTVLDVGSWTGAFGFAIKNANPQATVWAVEPNPTAAATAATRVDNVVNKPMQEALAELPLNHFDVIFFNDVLEHVVDPWQVLRESRALLRASGHVVASLPNIRCLRVTAPLVLRGEWSYKKDGLLDRTHLRFFTKSSMRTLFVDAGYEVEEQQPLHLVRSGRLAALAKLAGRWSEEFRCVQYAVRARPLPSPDHHSPR